LPDRVALLIQLRSLSYVDDTELSAAQILKRAKLQLLHRAFRRPSAVAISLTDFSSANLMRTTATLIVGQFIHHLNHPRASFGLLQLKLLGLAALAPVNCSAVTEESELCSSRALRFARSAISSTRSATARHRTAHP
jgi:hypothetical protein